MTRLVVDASVVVKWFFAGSGREADASLALRLLADIRAGTVDVVQPPHWLVEAAAVIARLDAAIATRAVSLLYAMQLPVDQAVKTYQRGCDLAIQLDQHPFDTLYHAVALCHSDAVLITADDRYYAKAQAVGSIRRLRSYSAGLAQRSRSGPWRDECRGERTADN